MSSICSEKPVCQELKIAKSYILELIRQNTKLIAINKRLLSKVQDIYSFCFDDTGESCRNILTQTSDATIKPEYKNEAYFKTITALTTVIDAKDTYTRSHSKNVARYAVVLGRGLGVSSKELINVYNGAVLHDIGKIGIPDKILNKPGNLTPDEFEVIRNHPAIGAKLLEPINFLTELQSIVVYHHERYDGSGYPHGLKGESIPYTARIVGIADTWDAMTSHRPYRQALKTEEALRELEKGSGSQFDPAMVNTFISLVKNPDNIEFTI
ncbi:MAG: HD-GYP domain-containing protein [Bacillota bacterium]